MNITKKISILIIFVIFILAAILFLRLKGGRIVSPQGDIANDAEPVIYLQKDKKWASEKIGDSDYTLENSGCIVCCIASALSMKKNRKITPSELNAEFSENDIYDNYGNIIWDKLSDLGYCVTVYDDVSSDILEDCLNDGKYPIVRVRMYGLGSFHYVLVIKAENSEFYCVDPLDDEICSLKKFGNMVYAVRCVC